MAKRTRYQSEAISYLDKSDVRPRTEHDKYQALSVEEDQQRTNVHYEQPVEFFYTLTGGEWNVYSCNLWPDDVTTVTQSQEAKLDRVAELLELKPGMRLLDVGCGWAGPLVYLSKKYNVEGVGLTLSPTQKKAADERIASYGANVQVHVCHWKEYEDSKPFDAVYTDEVIVHFNDLLGFFKAAYELMRPGGLMLNKEFHYTSNKHKVATRGEVFMNEIYGFTGNYRMLVEELGYLDEGGFELVWHETLPLRHYMKTMDSWLHHLHANRDRLIEVVGKDTYSRFRMYLKLGRVLLNTPVPTMDITVARKPS